jgi:phosphatidylglycerol:prolipoprotein diacylglycerol transferase
MRPILFTVFGFPIHSYGVMIVIAFFVGAAICRKRAARLGMDTSKLIDGLIGALLLGILGARLTYIAQEIPYYTTHPKELLTFEVAGITSFGGILFGLGYLLWWAKRHNIKLTKMIDVIGPPFLVANAIGRVGCLLNGCCYGVACPPSMPWKIHVAGLSGWFHPAQMYDAAMCLIAYALVVSLEKLNRAQGQSFAMALAGYGLSRFIYEFWRSGTDAQVAAGQATSTYWIGWLTQAQAVAGLMAVAGVVMYVRLGMKQTVPSLDSATA